MQRVLPTFKQIDYDVEQMRKVLVCVLFRLEFARDLG